MNELIYYVFYLIIEYMVGVKENLEVVRLRNGVWYPRMKDMKSELPTREKRRTVKNDVGEIEGCFLVVTGIKGRKFWNKFKRMIFK